MLLPALDFGSGLLASLAGRIYHDARSGTRIRHALYTILLMAETIRSRQEYRPGEAIVLVEHDPAWSELFVDEAGRIREALEGSLLMLHHIGSTAIPGMPAKPVIDMLAVITDVRALDRPPPTLERLDYEGLGEFGIPGRRYFRKTSATGVRTHQVHAFGRGSTEIQRHLDFRDYLCAHSPEAAAYGDLKRELAVRCLTDIRAYTAGKSNFIRDIERRTAAWRLSQAGSFPAA